MSPLSDAASAFLAEQYRTHTEVCHQMALVTLDPFKGSCLEFAEQWTNLAQEIEAKAALEWE